MITKCLICSQSVEFNDIVELHVTHDGKPYHIQECPACSVKQTFPKPEDLESLYVDKPYNQKQNFFYFTLKNLLIRMEINRIVKATKTTHFLDIGSGSGEFSYNILKKGYTSVASDSAPERPFYIQSDMSIPYVHFDYGTNRISNPEYVKGRVVILRHVLEHVSDPQTFLNQFISDGAAYFYIAVPHANCAEGKIFKNQNSFWHTPFHLWHHNLTSLSKLMDQLDCEIVTHGFDTIPMLLIHLSQYVSLHNYPKWIQYLLAPRGMSVVLASPLNLFFPNNVVWIVAKSRNYKPKK